MPQPLYEMHEVRSEQVKEVLALTKIDIQIAGERVEGTTQLWAAHNSHRSFVVLATSDNVITIWHLEGEDRPAREEAVNMIRSKYV